MLVEIESLKSKLATEETCGEDCRRLAQGLAKTFVTLVMHAQEFILFIYAQEFFILNK